MAIDRRQILGGLAAALACRLAGAPAAARAQGALYVSCRDDADGRSSAVVFSLEGAEVFSTILPARGHDAVKRPSSQEVVVFARRPGNWAVVFDVARGEVVRTLVAEPGRHYYGHGAFSADGKLLLSTENDTMSGNGILGIHDASDGYRRIGEIGSRGIGPHDLKLLPDGRTLVVANGGLRTLPESGREVLNRDDMQPNLAFLDFAKDETLGVLELDEDYRALSIRHLAVASDRSVLFGCQHEGDALDLPPLVGRAREGRIELLDMPELDLMAMSNYVGSVALDADEAVLAATSPRGGSVALWDSRSGRFLSRVAMSDVCGVAQLGREAFLLSSGNAGVRSLEPEAEHPAAAFGTSERWVWDNHLRRL